MTAIASKLVESLHNWNTSQDTTAARFVKSSICARVSGVVVVPFAALFDAFSNFSVAVTCLAIAAVRKVVNLAYTTDFLKNWNVDEATELYHTATAYLALATTSGLAFYDPDLQRSVCVRSSLLNLAAPIAPVAPASAAPASAAPASAAPASAAPAAAALVPPAKPDSKEVKAA